MVKLIYIIKLLIMSSENNILTEEQVEQDIKPEKQDEIYINNLTNKISQIIKSTNKNDFIKNYNEYHNKIKKVDEIIYKPNEIEVDIDIKILFEMLKEYDNLVDTEDISVEEYKKMIDLVEVIETKLKNMTFEIKEIQ